jgi:hypothetical protein
VGDFGSGFRDLVQVDRPFPDVRLSFQAIYDSVDPIYRLGISSKWHRPDRNFVDWIPALYLGPPPGGGP